MKTTALDRAYSALVTDWRFMASHGWTQTAYVARYGSTDSPRMGDGGNLIWQADIANHAGIRARFAGLVREARRVVDPREATIERRGYPMDWTHVFPLFQ